MTTQLLLDQWVIVEPCSAVTLMPAVVRNALYYQATGGQTVFNLSTPDLFALTYVMTDNNVDVFRSGGKLVPDNGTGIGGYTANFTTNSVTLLYPAGAGELIEIDFFVSAS